MRRAGPLVLGLWLTASGLVAAQDAPAPAPVAAPAETAPAVPAAPVEPPPPPPGHVHLVLFGPDSKTLESAIVELPDGTQATSNADGALRITMPPGEPMLRVHAGGAAPTPIEGVKVASDETTLVIATFDASGALVSADIQLPKTLTAPEEKTAEVAAPTGPPGTVVGKAVSLEGGAPVVGAKVYVRGQAGEAVTDGNGGFTLQLPEGAQRLSLIHTAFSTQTADVNVVAGETTTITVEMSPAAAELEDFVVTAPYIQGGVASLMADRRETAAVSDSIGAEDIARMPASSAAQAAQRVVGANIVDGRFVYVRGLGERYTNALLNGVPLPSPEPDRATVPLDLFPAQILESLEISKTFTPDVPGDFAGGSVRIVTRKVPEDLVLATSLSLGVNSESTFRDGFSQDASSTDWLGFDDGQRALSNDVPRDYQLTLATRKPDGDRLLTDELAEEGVKLNSPMSVEETTLWPNLSASLAVGDGWKLSDDLKLGVLSSLIYSRSEKARFDRVTAEYEFLENENRLNRIISYPNSDQVTEAVRWGAFTSVALEIADAHTLTLIGMHSQLADAETSVRYDGFSANRNNSISTSRMQFVSRGLSLVQLQGNHELEPLNLAKLDWTLSLARAARDEPDTRDVVYSRGRGNPWRYLSGTESGLHFFSEQDELSKTAALDWTQPISEGDFASTLKGGGMLTLKDRDFKARRFAFLEEDREDEDLVCGDQIDFIACPDRLFVDENIGTALRLDEGTRPGDVYRAALYVYAGYLMADLGFWEQWRLIGGARLEATEQSITPYDQFSGEVNEEKSNELKDLDVLPSLALVYSPLQDLNVRASITRTLARPQLRELAPFAFSDYFGGAQQSGEPGLKLTGILNMDLRVEVFPSPREVLALSLFAKDFTDPIEPISRPTGTTATVSYRNSPGAFLFGVEVEARKSLDFISASLEDFTAIGSLMIAESNIQIEQTSGEFLTNTERPMVQSAPYVINIALDYENKSRTQARILYNVTGPYIVEVGTDGLEDAYLHPQHLVDFTASQGLGEHFRIRATVQNILNAAVLVTQGRDDNGDNIRDRYRDGVSASLGVSYSH